MNANRFGPYVWKTYKEAYDGVLLVGSALRAFGANPVSIAFSQGNIIVNDTFICLSMSFPFYFSDILLTGFANQLCDWFVGSNRASFTITIFMHLGLYAGIAR